MDINAWPAWLQSEHYIRSSADIRKMQAQGAQVERRLMQLEDIKLTIPTRNIL